MDLKKKLEILDEESENALDDEISTGLNRSKRQNDTPEILSSTTPPKRRGRPRGSTNRSTAKPSLSFTEKQWSDGAALILGLATTYFAMSFMHDAKYVMTKQEAQSAASGIVYCLFQYNSVREFATKTRLDGPVAVLAKGFWPYISRVFVKDMIENVIAGLAVSQRQSGPRPNNPGPKTNSTGGSPNTRSNNGTPANDEYDARINGLNISNFPIDWRGID